MFRTKTAVFSDPSFAEFSSDEDEEHAYSSEIVYHNETIQLPDELLQFLKNGGSLFDILDVDTVMECVFPPTENGSNTIDLLLLAMLPTARIFTTGTMRDHPTVIVHDVKKSLEDLLSGASIDFGNDLER
jgi:hypothetical protein